MPSGVNSWLGWYPKYVVGEPAFHIPVTDDSLQVVQDCNGVSTIQSSGIWDKRSRNITE